MPRNQSAALSVDGTRRRASAALGGGGPAFSVSYLALSPFTLIYPSITLFGSESIGSIPLPGAQSALLGLCSCAVFPRFFHSYCIIITRAYGLNFSDCSDLATDSWRSKTVAVLIFVSVYVQFATIILGYFGVSVTEVRFWVQKSDIFFRSSR